MSRSVSLLWQVLAQPGPKTPEQLADIHQLSSSRPAPAHVTPYPYQWGPLLRENATASLEFVGWLLRGAPGPWCRTDLPLLPVPGTVARRNAPDACPQRRAHPLHGPEAA